MEEPMEYERPRILEGERLRIQVTAPIGEPRPVHKALAQSFERGTEVEAFGMRWRVVEIGTDVNTPPYYSLVCYGPAVRSPP